LWLSEFATVSSVAGLGYELLVIAGVVVGGVAIFGGSGTVLGAALGVILLNTINQALVALRISSFWDEALAGALLITAIAFDRYVFLRRERANRARIAAMPQRDVVETEAGAGEAPLSPPTVDQPQPVTATASAATRGPGSDGNHWAVGRWPRRFRDSHCAVRIGRVPLLPERRRPFRLRLNIGPIALMALPLTFIVMTGEIDLSVASTLGWRARCSVTFSSTDGPFLWPYSQCWPWGS